VACRSSGRLVSRTTYALQIDRAPHTGGASGGGAPRDRAPGHEHGGNDTSHIRRFDHVGITVADLDAATQFFVALGLEIEGRTFVEGEFIDTVIGIPGSRTEIVMLRPPDKGTGVELSSFVRPSCVPGSRAAMANEVGLRSVAFEVHDLDAAVDQATSAGYGLVGGIGEYEGSWRMAYVRGPEGIIVALAQPIG
jgi:catechol 2,3-dioxygenase-like lactoylglutathione lyase family enzyme